MQRQRVYRARKLVSPCAQREPARTPRTSVCNASALLLANRLHREAKRRERGRSAQPRNCRWRIKTEYLAESNLEICYWHLEILKHPIPIREINLLKFILKVPKLEFCELSNTDLTCYNFREIN